MRYLKVALGMAALGVAVGLLLAVNAWRAVPTEIGTTVPARPMPVISQPHHPMLAESERSSMHGGSYNRDLNTYPGPLGHDTHTAHRAFSWLVGVAPNIAFDSAGRLITVSLQLGGIELHLLDPETLETLAVAQLPAKASFDDNSGGGYFHLDDRDRVLLAPSDKTITIYEVTEGAHGPEWQVAEIHDLSHVLPEGVNVHDVIPDWVGNLWFVTGGNLLGYRHKDTGEIFTYEMEADDELIQNSFAVDAQGLYVVSTDSLYLFQTDPAGDIVYVWREDYENGETQKPGTLSHGSGTSPTLIGDDLVAIADDGHPFTHVMVYHRGEEIEGDRVVCKVPLFEAGKSATENSLMVYGDAMVVQNDYGHVFEGNALETSPGVMRIDVREDRSGCDIVWYNKEMISQSLPRLSMATGLLYFYTFKKQAEGDFFGGWYLTAVDFDTGEELWDRLISPGTGTIIDPLSSVTAPVVMGPNGAAYVGIRTGVVMAKDRASPLGGVAVSAGGGAG
ncbi:MAG: hypothetical protein VCC00_06150 [Deltaproteobacteria bacterium]